MHFLIGLVGCVSHGERIGEVEVEEDSQLGFFYCLTTISLSWKRRCGL
jgi:hypothetical protein